MFKFPIVVIIAAFAAACHEIPHEDQYTHSQANDVAGLAIMAQMMVVAGAPGLALLPFLIAADIHATDAAMVEARSRATIGQTYQYAYDRSLDSVGGSGSTGEIFRDMKSATAHFRTVLRGHGVTNPDSYVLTAVRTADRVGFTLYALIYRPVSSVQVRTTSGRIRRLTGSDEDFYRPFRFDAYGQPVDVVVDWAGVERRLISTQKGQAILLTLAANSVIINRRSDDYWSAHQLWLSGQYQQVVAERRREIERRLGQS